VLDEFMQKKLPPAGRWFMTRPIKKFVSQETGLELLF